MSDLLLEIGCEEIPARMVPDALAQMAEKAKELFARERVSHKEIRIMGTPRRLTLAVIGAADMQESKEIEKWGPGSTRPMI